MHCRNCQGVTDEIDVHSDPMKLRLKSWTYNMVAWIIVKKVILNKFGNKIHNPFQMQTLTHLLKVEDAHCLSYDAVSLLNLLTTF